MNCERLKGLIKNWYINVQSETMAPARMVAFMSQHIVECEVCIADEGVTEEVEKIREIVLPPSKIPKKKEDDMLADLEDEDEEVGEGEVGDSDDTEEDDVDDEEEVLDEEEDDFEEDIV